MHGFLPIFFLLVVLKIPVFGSLWLVWWASQEPEPDGTAAEDSDGGFGRPPPLATAPARPPPRPWHRRWRRGEGAGVPADPRRHACPAKGGEPSREGRTPPPSHTA